MVFSSAIFIFFFLPIFLFLNTFIKKQFQIALLIISSLLFYIWGEGYGVILLLALCLFNYLIGRLIRRSLNQTSCSQALEFEKSALQTCNLTPPRPSSSPNLDNTTIIDGKITPSLTNSLPQEVSKHALSAGNCVDGNPLEHQKRTFGKTSKSVLSKTVLSPYSFFINKKIWLGLDAQAWLFLGIIINLGALFYYKYFSWVLSELEKIWPFSLYDKFNFFGITPTVALPLGISFFCFHGISYLVDAYKGAIGRHSASDFFAYFLMFPHLVAGPIVRFESIRNNLQSKNNVSLNSFSQGLLRFIIGVNKKVLIANSVAPLADIAFFSSSASISWQDAWLGALAYTIQIYFDFSGYSDMAIGLAGMLGIKFDENFLSPYKSLSIKDFWRRWHISLSSWLRDYLYIPLGGSRSSTVVTYRNLLIVFICCGFWHGAQFTFLLWGLYHGLLLILERTPLGKALESLPNFIRRFYSLALVIIGWVFFRALNLDHAMNYLYTMFNFLNPVPNSIHLGLLNVSALILGFIVALWGRDFPSLMKIRSFKLKIGLVSLNLVLFVLSLSILYTDNRNPFIYFNF